VFKAKNHYYDGWFYRKFIDPNLQEIREIIASRLPSRCTAIDIGCGTGALIFSLAQKCKRLVGIELSPKMLAFAKQEKEKSGLQNVEFFLGDATRLAQFRDKEFDVAFTSMVLHEMPASQRPLVIREMVRVAKRVILADYAVPQPRNQSGLTTFPVEFVAGPSHFRGFLSFTKNGGLPGLLHSLDFGIKTSDLNRARTIQVVELDL
jgi:SAM-dependent methyltransferase